METAKNWYNEQNKRERAWDNSEGLLERTNSNSWPNESRKGCTAIAIVKNWPITFLAYSHELSMEIRNNGWSSDLFSPLTVLGAVLSFRSPCNASGRCKLKYLAGIEYSDGVREVRRDATYHHPREAAQAANEWAEAAAYHGRVHSLEVRTTDIISRHSEIESILTLSLESMLKEELTMQDLGCSLDDPKRNRLIHSINQARTHLARSQRAIRALFEEPSLILNPAQFAQVVQ